MGLSKTTRERLESHIREIEAQIEDSRIKMQELTAELHRTRGELALHNLPEGLRDAITLVPEVGHELPPFWQDACRALLHYVGNALGPEASTVDILSHAGLPSDEFKAWTSALPGGHRQTGAIFHTLSEPFRMGMRAIFMEMTQRHVAGQA